MGKKKHLVRGKGRDEGGGIRYKFVSSRALVLSDPLLSPLPVNNKTNHHTPRTFYFEQYE